MKTLLMLCMLLAAAPIAATEFSLGTPFQVADSTGWFVPLRVTGFPGPTMQGVRVKLVPSGLTLTDGGCGPYFPACAALVQTVGDTTTAAVIEPDPCPQLPDSGTVLFLRAHGSGFLHLERVDLLLDCDGQPLEATANKAIVPVPPLPTAAVRSTWGRVKGFYR